MKRIVLIVSLLCSSVASVFAADWSSTNVQFLTGDDFVNPFSGDEYSNNILTMEHASGWKYGDNFFFVDVINGDGDTDTEFYGEFSPRLSFGKMSGHQFGGFVKDVLLATQWNFGKDNGVFGGANVSAYLIGAGVDLAVPGAAFFQVNVYQRTEHSTAIIPGVGTFYTNDSTLQLTVVGLFPFSLGSTKWSIGGFADYIGKIEDNKAHLLFAPQILMDIGALAGAPGRLEAGIEYSYWKNKFGVDIPPIGTSNERVVELMIKWTL